jgi:hypothetical protein
MNLTFENLPEEAKNKANKLKAIFGVKKAIEICSREIDDVNHMPFLTPHCEFWEKTLSFLKEN